MSNTAAISRKEKRRPLDAYFTPSWATEELLKIVSLSGIVLEPCVGQGDISKVFVASGLRVITNDIDPQVKAHTHFDASLPEYWNHLKFSISWIPTNPPFSLASKIIPHAFEKAEVGIAMLLRGSYTEPTFDRQNWLKEHEKHLAHIIYLPRISFTGDSKTDSVSANWYVYTKEKAAGCRLTWVLKEKRKNN